MSRLVLVFALLVGAAVAQDGAGWGTPDTRPLGERCRVPHQLDDPRAMEVHLRCLLAGLGNPVVLPNPFGEDPVERDNEQDLFRGYCDAVDEVLRHLDGLKEQIDGGARKPTGAAVGDLDELVRSSADAVRAFKEAVDRAAEGDRDGRGGVCNDLFNRDAETGPDGTVPVPLPDNMCDLLRNAQPDDGARPDDAEYENGLGRVGINVNLGAHLVPFPRWGHPHKPIERIASGEVPAGGAFVVLKEFFGLRLKLYWRWVPIWQEPWTSRAKIIGYRRRLYLRWVPCEYLKSIVYQRHSADGLVQPHVVSRNWCDHSLLGFWRFF